MAQPVEPVLTWNLFWTTIVVPVSVFVLGWYLKRMETRKEQQKGREKELEEENRRLVASELLAWRERFTNTLCGVKKTVESIDARLDSKRETVECNKMNDDVWKAIDVVRQRQHDDMLTLNGKRT